MRTKTSAPRKTAAAPEPQTLSELRSLLRAGRRWVGAPPQLYAPDVPLPMLSLPVFGPPVLQPAADVVSWDDTRLLIEFGVGRFRIVPRTDDPELF